MDTTQMECINPATGERFARVAKTPAGAGRQTIAELRGNYKSWAQTSFRERSRILGKLQDEMIEAVDEISAVLTRDTGKSRQDALIEVWMTIDLLRTYRKHGRKWLAKKNVSPGLYFFKRCYVEYQPYGVVLVIAPWNYPFYLSLPPMISALLAGNAVILKPSEITAATGELIERLFQRVPELRPYVRVLHGDGQTGAELVSAGPDYIFLTGSTGTGKKVAQAAAANLTPLACELGGKDATIVLEDADLKSAAYWTVWGAFFNTGQTCMGVERVFVVQEVYDEFVRLVVEETRRLKIGYTEDIDSPYYLGPMSDARQVRIIEKQMEDARAKGVQVHTGGSRREMFLEPLVLTGIRDDMLLMQEETFGPILPVIQVKDEEEAIRRANDSLFGLGASVWSRNIQRAERVARQLEVGTILVNDALAQIAVPMLPFGGRKHSGSGRVHGREGLLQFAQPVAFAVGNAPYHWDISVIMRKPGHYRMGSALMHLLMGTSWRQRLKAISIWRNKPAKPKMSVNGSRSSGEMQA